MNLYQPANGATIGQARDMIAGPKPVDLVIESEGVFNRRDPVSDIDETDD